MTPPQPAPVQPPVTCPNCNTQNRPSANNCIQCGQALPRPTTKLGRLPAGQASAPQPTTTQTTQQVAGQPTQTQTRKGWIVGGLLAVGLLLAACIGATLLLIPGQQIRWGSSEGNVLYTVTTETPLRSEARTDSTLIQFVPQGQTVTVLEQVGSWLKVRVTGSDIAGYVYAEDAMLSSELENEASTDPTAQILTDPAEEVPAPQPTPDGAGDPEL
jgi:Bacterial SH3 domain